MDPTIIAAAIGAGGSLLSAGMSRSTARRALKFQKRQYNENLWRLDQARDDQFTFAKESAGWQFKDIMEAADESGIHRLAAIGGAQASGYTPAGGSNMSLNTEDGNSIAGDAIASGISSIADAWAKSQEKKTAEAMTRKAEAEADKAELEVAQSRTRLQEQRRVAQGQNPPVSYDEAGQEMIGPLSVAGFRLEPDKTFSDAEWWEGRYGEPVSWLYGLGVLAADARKHVLKRTGTDNIDDAVKVIAKRSRGWQRDLEKETKEIQKKSNRKKTEYKDNDKAKRTRNERVY